MAWTSKFQAGFTKPLIRQIVGILNRDMQAALDNVSGAPGSLHAFAEWDLATVARENFPACVIFPLTVEFDAESLGTLAEKTALLVTVAVTHQDANVCAESAQDYVRAVDEVLNSAWWLTPADFTLATLPLPSPPFASGATTPGLEAGALTRVFVHEHSYDDLKRTRRGMFETTASLTVVVELEET
jgi:hypothetical protein